MKNTQSLLASVLALSGIFGGLAINSLPENVDIQNIVISSSQKEIVSSSETLPVDIVKTEKRLLVPQTPPKRLETQKLDEILPKIDTISPPADILKVSQTPSLAFANTNPAVSSEKTIAEKLSYFSIIIYNGTGENGKGKEIASFIEKKYGVKIHRVEKAGRVYENSAITGVYTKEIQDWFRLPAGWQKVPDGITGIVVGQDYKSFVVFGGQKN